MYDSYQLATNTHLLTSTHCSQHMHTTTTPRDILHSTFDPVNLVHFSRVHVVDKEAPPDATGNDLPPIGGEASSEDWEVLQVETLQLGVGVTVDLWERGEGRGKGREVGRMG